MPVSKSNGEIVIQATVKEKLEVYILGTKPLLCNRLSEKAQHELMLPKPRGSGRGGTNLKHDPYEEYARSPYRLPDLLEDGKPSPTLIAVMASTFKGAMMTAALDQPEAKKAQIGRLVWVDANNLNLTPIYGVPKLFMSVTRSADINHTPDIRTRAILPEWAAFITVSYLSPNIRANSVANLLGMAGLTAGIGDWRPEKGKGSYGQFVIANDDPKLMAKWQQIVASGGRKVQRDALDVNPVPYDNETRDLLGYFTTEASRRGFSVGPGQPVTYVAGAGGGGQVSVSVTGSAGSAGSAGSGDEGAEESEDMTDAEMEETALR